MQRSVIKLFLLALWLTPLSASCAEDAKIIAGDAIRALGADGLKTLEYSGSGFDFALGQASNPGSPWPKFIEKSYTRVVDFEGPASYMKRVRAQGTNPPKGGGGGGIFGGGIIFGDQPGEQIINAGTPQAKALPDELTMALPLGFLRSAAAASDLTAAPKVFGNKKYTALSFTASNKATVHGYLNEQYILEKVETTIDNNVLGDIPFATEFTDYRDFNGLKFPTHIVQKQAGYPVFDLTVTEVKANPGFKAYSPTVAPVTGGNGPATPEMLGEGVWLIGGGYVALAVDFQDYIVIVEAPQNEQRAEAILAEAKRLIPNKPVRYVVNTHAHFDHSGGLRTFVAEGATIVTHKMNAAYYEKIWTNPHNLNRDKLSRNPRKPEFRAFDDKLVLSGGGHFLELYHLRNFAHNDGMIVVYLPRERLLFEADGFNPPGQPIVKTPDSLNVYTTSLVDNIDRLRLDVERVIPVHYPPGNRRITMLELRTAAGRLK